jgi:hypothetical protein
MVRPPRGALPGQLANALLTGQSRSAPEFLLMENNQSDGKFTLVDWVLMLLVFARKAGDSPLRFAK